MILKLKDESQDERCGAARALGEMKSKSALEPLIARLEDKSETVRYVAYNAVLEILAHHLPDPGAAPQSPGEESAVPGPWSQPQ